MKEFYEEYKMLINTESSYKDGTPHVMLTGTDYCTQHKVGEVSFDYQKVYDREDTYHDVMGFYHTHPPGRTGMRSIDIETMTQWVKCLGKSLVCLIETDDSLNGWMFVKDEKAASGVSTKELSVNTFNDVNYDIWMESSSSFWHPADFLLNGERFEEGYDEEDEDEATELMLEGIAEIRENQENIINGFNTLVETVQALIQTITKEEDDE